VVARYLTVARIVILEYAAEIAAFILRSTTEKQKDPGNLKEISDDTGGFLHL
jgi:hypothetical protein